MSNPALFNGPILVTAAYFILWYALLFRQIRTKYRLREEYAGRNETFDRYFGKDPHMLAMDRAVVNTQEQMVPFFCPLASCCGGVSCAATIPGTAYVLFRALYPVPLGPKPITGGKKLSLPQSLPTSSSSICLAARCGRPDQVAELNFPLFRRKRGDKG